MNSNYPPIHFTLAATDATRPLVEIVTDALGGDNAAAVQIIARGGLWVDRARVQDGTIVGREGAPISIHRPPSGAYSDVVITATQIIYEDDYLLALNKPAGLYVDATPWDATSDVLVALQRLIAARDGVVPPLRAAHRLDRDTTGVLLISKNPQNNRMLQKMFNENAIHKQYLAMCVGEPSENEWTIETGHGRESGGRFRVYPLEHIGQLLLDGSKVRAMKTRFSVARRLGDAALVRAFPISGRTHQIRLHLAYAGHPLVGDAKYGGPTMWHTEPVLYHRLHAARLELPHPRTKEILVLEAAVPEWGGEKPT